MWFAHIHLLTLCLITTADYSGNLQSVQIFFRHGERYWTNLFSSMLPDNFSMPPDFAPGELTQNGIRQAYQLGVKYRNFYGSFVGTKYKPSTLRVYAGYDNRTIVSALSLLAGFFPPQDGQVWNKDILWQPIPVHTDFLFDAVSIGATDHCPALADYAYRSPKYSTLLQLTADERSMLQKLLKVRIDGIVDLLKVLDMIIEMKRLGYKLPPHLQQYNSSDQMQKKLFLHQKFIEIILPQTGGFLLNTVVEELENNVKGNGNHSLILYSTHDVTVTTIAMYLNITELIKLCDFCSSLIFEHYKFKGEDIVRLWHLNGLSGDREEVFIPRCQSPCKISQLRQIIPKITRNVFLQLCKEVMRRLFFLVLSFYSLISVDGSGTLRLVQVFFRHGERLPTRFVSLSHTEENVFSTFDIEFGELTNNGINQCYNLGKTIRSFYVDYIGQKYIPSKIRIDAGDENRTIASALALSIGLFPSNSIGTMNWQPIPVHTTTLLDAVSASVLVYCPNLSAKVRKRPLYKLLAKENVAFKKWLNEKTGYNSFDPETYQSLLDTIIMTKVLAPDSLPSWASSSTFVDYARLKLYEFHNHFLTVVPEVGGYLFDKIVQAFEDKINKNTKQSLLIYSAHDTTILTLSRLLQITEIDSLIDFCASLTFELHYVDDQKIIELWYQPNISTARFQVQTPWCRNPCVYENFKILALRLSQDKFAKVCFGTESLCQI